MQTEAAQSYSNQTLHRIEQCEKLLDTLKAGYAANFDSSRFCQLESMLQHCKKKRESVALNQLSKLLTELDHFKSEFDMACEEAALLADQLDYQFPDARPQVQALYEQRRIAELKRLAEKLRQSKRFQEGSLGKLQELRRQLEAFGISSHEDDQANSFEQQLRAQESEALSEMYGDAAPFESGPTSRPESPAMRNFKAAKEKHYIDDIVTQAIREKPENPGPINPHMLAIRSLTLMQELSPAYLGKFIQTMDTLFYLENAKQSTSEKKDSAKTNVKAKK